jgi:hypothetical protein
MIPEPKWKYVVGAIVAVLIAVLTIPYHVAVWAINWFHDSR